MSSWAQALTAVVVTCIVGTRALAAGGTIADGAARLTYPATHWDGSPEADLTGGLSDVTQDVAIGSGWWLRVPFYGDDREYALSAPYGESSSANSAAYVSSHHGLNVLEHTVVDDSGWWSAGATAVSRLRLRNELGIRTPVFLYHVYTPGLVWGATYHASVTLSPGYHQVTSYAGSLGVANVGYRAPGAQHLGCTTRSLTAAMNDGDDDYFSLVGDVPSLGPVNGRPVECGAQWSFWLGAGETRTFYVALTTAIDARFGKGDLDFDGQADILWQKPGTPDLQVWAMRDTVWRESQDFGPFAEPVVAQDDFDADREGDYVTRHPTTGRLSIVPCVGRVLGTPVEIANPEPLGFEWRVVGTGTYGTVYDTPDLVLQNDVTGELRIWLMNGITRVGTLIPTPASAPDPSWRAVAVHTFGSPGLARLDLLFQNLTTGRLVIWRMGTDGVRTAGQFTNPAEIGDLNWHVVAAGDYGIGTGGTYRDTTDIVWRNAISGRLVVWRMAYGSRVDGVFTTPDGAGMSGYEVVAPH